MTTNDIRPEPMLQSMPTEIAGGPAPSPVKTALPDIRNLALVVALALCSLGVVAGVMIRCLDMRGEAARLEAAIRRAGDVEKRLDEVAAAIHEARVELATLGARTPADLRPEQLEDRIEFRSKALGLELVPQGRWQPEQPAPLGDGSNAKVRRYDRTIEVRGGCKEGLALLAEIEAWPELVSVRRFHLRRVAREPGAPGGEAKRGATVSRIEASAFQAVEEGKP